MRASSARVAVALRAMCVVVAMTLRATSAHSQISATATGSIPLALGAPELVSAAEFTYALSAVRFVNGDILVADAGDRDIKLVNGRTGAVRVIGRAGSGPGEYQQPSRVIPWATNTALVIDGQLMRATVYDATGAALRSANIPARSGLPDLSVSADRAGRVYFGTPQFDAARGMPAPMQTVTRWTWGASHTTAITTIQGPLYHSVAIPTGVNGSNGLAMRLTSQNVPYANADLFAVLSDGTQAIARGATRIVEWRDSTGRVRESTAFPGAPIAITDSARAQVKFPELRAMIGRWYAPFAAVTFVVSSSDRVWLRSTPERADSADWLGFKRGEATPQRIRLPRAALIVGVAEPYLMVLRRDEDDLQRLEVYRLPR